MVVTAPAPTSGPKLLAFLNAMELKKDRKEATQGRFAGVGNRGGGGDRSGVVSAAEHLKNVAHWLEALQKLQLGLGDPLGNPQVKQRTAWMTDKKSVARLLNDRYSLVPNVSPVWFIWLMCYKPMYSGKRCPCV